MRGWGGKTPQVIEKIDHPLLPLHLCFLTPLPCYKDQVLAPQTPTTACSPPRRTPMSPPSSVLKLLDSPFSSIDRTHQRQNTFEIQAVTLPRFPFRFLPPGLTATVSKKGVAPLHRICQRREPKHGARFPNPPKHFPASDASPPKTLVHPLWAEEVDS